MSDWTREKTLMLIEKVYESGIWNRKQYKNVKLRSSTFQKISDDLKSTKKEVEDKWHTVKSQFSRELSRINNSKKSATCPEDVYVPSWYAFEPLQFLTDESPYMEWRITNEETINDTLGAGSIETEVCTVEDSPIVFQFADCDSGELDGDRKQKETRRYSGTPVPSDPSTSSWNRQGVQRNHKRKKLEDSSITMQAISAMGESIARSITSDEFTVYGEYVASQLGKLRGVKYRRLLAKARLKINNILSEIEMEKIELDENQ